MTGSTLALTFDDLRKQVGVYLGYGDSPSRWQQCQTEEVRRDLDSGLRAFYFPALMPGDRKSHEWSFLRPTGSFITADGIGDYDLPEDFGGLIGSLTLQDDDSAYFNITLTGEGRIRALRQNNLQTLTASGRPELAAVRPKDHDGLTQQLFEVLLWPTPITTNTIQFRYNVLPSALTSTLKHPYGGAAYSETVLLACLAAAERRQNDNIGMYNQQFMQALQASIARDRSTMAEDNFGYNGDWSEGVSMPRRPYLQQVTYNGSLYED